MTASKRSLAFIAVVFLATASLAFAIMSQTYLNHDSSWYLIATRRFMQGGRLYIDLVEINPPLSFYLTVPGLWIADASGWSDKVGFMGWVTLVALAGSCWAASITLRTTLSTGEKGVLVAVLPIITLVFQINEFGQREHLMMGFCAPYLYRMILRERVRVSRFEDMAIGTMSFFGFALKPYFYAVPALLALMVARRDSSIRTPFNAANLALAALTIGYVAFIRLVHPEYLDIIVPIAREVYQSFGFPVWKRWAQPAFFALPFIMIIANRVDRSVGDVASYLLTVSAGFLLTYFIQFKGWNYHIVPASAFLFVSSAWLAYTHRAKLRADIALSALFLVAATFTLGQQLHRGFYRPISVERFSKFHQPTDVTILILSSNVGASFPFVNETGARWGSRYPAQWLIPGAIVTKANSECSESQLKCARLDRILAKARGDIVADMQHFAPDLIYIDERQTKSYFKGLAFDYLDFLRDEAEFAGIWSEYERVGKVYNYGVYRKTNLAVRDAQ